jgi:hypothetical protein
VVEVVLIAIVSTTTDYRVKNSAVIGLIIVSSLCLILNFCILYLRKQKEEEEPIEAYGFRATHFLTKVRMLDLEGTCEVTREWVGLKVSNNYQLPYVPGIESISTIGGKIEEPTKLTHVGDFSKIVDLHHTKTTENSCVFQVKIYGNLTTDDPALNYSYKTVMSRVFAMTEEEAVEMYKNENSKDEYFSTDSIVPITDKMEIEIIFPKKYNVSPYPSVLLGPFEFMHEKEFQRIKHGFRRTRNGAIFTIERPQIGFRYLVCWKPLNRDSVDKLRHGT